MTAKDTPVPLRRRAFDMLTDLYVFALGRPALQPVNNRILNMALRARGYNNWADLSSSGEAAVVRLVARAAGTLCIDVGANVGNYSRALLEGTGATVIAFEPLPRAFAELQQLANRFGDRLITVNKGVAHTSGELELRYGAEDSELASFSPEVNGIDYVGKSNRNILKVPVVTLDEYLSGDGRERVARGIDLLKVDTEGYEYEVLCGARHTLESIPPKFVQLEFNWHQLFRGQSLYRLAGLLPGYQCFQLLPRGRGLIRVEPSRPESNIYHYSNFVFVRHDIRI